ncbi:hypothetical protein, partial [Gaoshiqia sediminis]
MMGRSPNAQLNERACSLAAGRSRHVVTIRITANWKQLFGPKIQFNSFGVIEAIRKVNLNRSTRSRSDPTIHHPQSNWGNTTTNHSPQPRSG